MKIFIRAAVFTAVANHRYKIQTTTYVVPAKMLLLFYASLSLAATWRESSFSLTAIGNEAGQIRTLYNRRHLLITTRIPEKASPQQQLKEIFCSNERELAIAFANMAHNAYIGGENTENWKKTADYAMEKAFGWGGEGLRGYAYVSQDQKVVVLAFKGTSAYLFPFKAGTGKQDRLNDNVMYSCCYGRDLSNLIPGFEKECRVKEDVIAYLNNTELHYYAACVSSCLWFLFCVENLQRNAGEISCCGVLVYWT